MRLLALSLHRARCSWLLSRFVQRCAYFLVMDWSRSLWLFTTKGNRVGMLMAFLSMYTICTSGGYCSLRSKYTWTFEYCTLDT